ncbi:MAG: putative unusual protein kinase regulating ubiquinone biosynthesis (AarF/ABC1/UbiB family) [Verrucomicrobiales bacterium]|jgi:predicted unusual protein kinase regulating ubiquinone biosynthesis (AarF/ABC1/UbiB family)
MISPDPPASSATHRKNKAKHSRLIEARIAEIQRCLLRNELTPGSAVWISLGEHKSLIQRFAEILDGLGIVFRYFQRYLSFRPDLITADDCLILEAALSNPPPLDEGLLKHLLKDRWKDDIRETTGEYKQESSEAFFILSKQTSSGTLRLEFHRDTFISFWETDRHCIATLAPIIRRIWPHLEAAHLISDFQNDTANEMDFGSRLNWLKSAPKATDGLANECMITPRVHDDFSSDSCIALRDIPGDSVKRVFQLDKEVPENPNDVSFGGSRHGAVARVLCQSWLNQMFLGDWFPISLRPSHLSLVRGDRNVYFHGGAVFCPSTEWQMLLLAYVMASAFGIPDEVAESLAELMEPEAHCQGLEVLKRRIGQIVPYRDGGWAENGKSDLLADHLFIQWRIAKECGYRESEQFQSFHRSFFALAYIAVRFAPKSDLLRDAIYEFRMRKAVTDLIESGKLSSMIEQGEKGMELFFDIGHKIKRITERNSARLNEIHSRSKNERSTTFQLFGLYMALLAVAVVASKVPRNFEGLMAAAFLVVASALVYGVTRLK